MMGRALAESIPDFAETKGPGREKGNGATSRFLEALQQMAKEEFGERCQLELPGVPGVKSASDFYFPEDKTLVELALSLHNPASEFHKDVLKAVLARHHKLAVEKLVFLAKRDAEAKHQAPLSCAIVKWARETQGIEVIVRDILPPSHTPSVFLFSAGGHFGPNCSLEWTEEGLVYKSEGGQQPNEEAIFLPTAGEWKSFWRALEMAKVWNWKPHYDETLVLDGENWELKIEYAGKRIATGGANDYPGAEEGIYTDRSEYAQFLRAMKRLTGKDVR